MNIIGKLFLQPFLTIFLIFPHKEGILIIFFKGGIFLKSLQRREKFKNPSKEENIGITCITRVY